MTTRNEIIWQIEQQLGSEGSAELAAAMLPLLEREGCVTFDPQNGYRLSLPDNDNDALWHRLIAEADDSE